MAYRFNPFTGTLDEVEEPPSGAGDVFHTAPLTADKIVLGAGTDYVKASGIDVDASDNLTGANTISVVDTTTTRTNLGLEIGVDVQAYNIHLDEISGLTLSEGDILYVNASGEIVNLPRGSNGEFLTLSAGNVAWASLSGGDVTGPASATDEGIARFDLTTGKLIQNSINTITDAGAFLSASGSASLPTYAFTSDVDSGMYLELAGTIAWATGGSKRLSLGATGILSNFGGVSVLSGNLKFNEALIANSREVAGDITGGLDDFIMAVSDTSVPRTVTVRNLSNTGQAFVIKDTSGNASVNNITVTTPGGTVTIDGQTSITIDKNYGSIAVWFDGTSYWSFSADYEDISSGIGGSTGATDNAILRADGSGGSTLQSSSAIVTDNGEIHTGQGSTSSCALASTNDIDTGFYFPAANNINLVIGGTTKLAFQSSAMLAGSGITGDIQLNYSSAGTASSPVYSFRGDANTGIYRVNTDQLGVSTGGVQACYWDASQIQHAQSPIYLPNGSGTAPAIAFENDPDCGFYRVGANETGYANNGALVYSMTSTYLAGKDTGDPKLNWVVGAEATPHYTFTSDENTGMYRVSADVLAFSTGGVQAMRFDSSQNMILANSLAANYGGTGKSTITQGDLLVGNGSNSYNLLGIGASGKVAKSNGTTVSWQDESLVLISSQSASASANIVFSSIPNFDVYLLTFEAIRPATDGAYLTMEMSNNDGSSWVTTGYTSGCNHSAYNSATLTNTNSTAHWVLSGDVDTSSSSNHASGDCKILNTNTGGRTFIVGNCSFSRDSDSLTANGNFGGKAGSTGANAFRVLMSSGNITSGTFRLYGLKNSP